MPREYTMNLIQPLRYYVGCLVLLFSLFPINAMAARDVQFCEENSVLLSCVDECQPSSTISSTNQSSAFSTPADCGDQGYDEGNRTASEKNKNQIWTFLKGKGMSDEAAAGIMGNMDKETGGTFLPDAVNSIGCSGVVQWCFERNNAMRAKALAEGKDWNCLSFQLDYMWYELTETAESAVMEPLKGAGTASEAAIIFEDKYERSNKATGEHLDRDRRAEEIYTAFTGKTPAASSSTSQDGCTGVRTGASSAVSEMNGFNYAFPVQLAQNEVSNGFTWPCPSKCHHDGSDAFDLFRTIMGDSSVGVGVVAITDGEIKRFNNSYAGVDGCQAFQLVGKDGYWYWYGHVQAASINEGASVTAGQVIAEIGRRACTGNGSLPHLHIDRGIKGTYGGNVGTRDPGFTDVMNELWQRLGGTAGDVNL